MCKGFDRGDKTKCEKEWRRDIIVEKKIIILMNNPSDRGRSCHAFGLYVFQSFLFGNKIIDELHLKQQQ